MPINAVLADCREYLPTLEPDSIDAVVCDPPYGLGFMGKDWDRGVPGAAFWQAALRVAKPGAHLLAFGGTRTFHRLACGDSILTMETRLRQLARPRTVGRWPTEARVDLMLVEGLRAVDVPAVAACCDLCCGTAAEPLLDAWLAAGFLPLACGESFYARRLPVGGIVQGPWLPAGLR